MSKSNWVHGCNALPPPGRNIYEIPEVPIEAASKFIVSPVRIWGETARGRGGYAGATILFYTDDDRFTGLVGEGEKRIKDEAWGRPDKLVSANPEVVMTPNFTLSLESPKSYVIWTAYRRMWLMWYWAKFGIKQIFDMNNCTEHLEILMAGLPRGWDAFITRGYSERLLATENEWEMAKWWAGKDDILFAVYGGGTKVRDWCKERQLIWLPETSDIVKGKVEDPHYNMSALLHPTRVRQSQSQSTSVQL